jgi:hypothetical protein
VPRPSARIVKKVPSEDDAMKSRRQVRIVSPRTTLKSAADVPTSSPTAFPTPARLPLISLFELDAPDASPGVMVRTAETPGASKVRIVRMFDSTTPSMPPPAFHRVA